MSTIKKECKVIMLSSTTQYKGSFSIMPSGKLHRNVLIGIPQDLYILSNDRIMKGDWFVQTDRISLGVIQATVDFGYDPLDVSKKVISTTDLLLSPPTYKQGVGVFSTRLPQLTDSFIEIFIESYNRGEYINKVMVECEGVLVTDFIVMGTEKVIYTDGL